MLKTAAIGVFDSGLGGLTTVRAIQETLPHESVIYFGDTAHLPYGDKSPETLQGYTREITRFLIEQGVKTVVVACNTASAVAFEEIKRTAGALPVFEVVQPAVDMAVKNSLTGKIGIIGTKTTVQSHIYRQRILEKNPRAQVVEKATPLLVPMIEEGWCDNKISREIIEAYLSDTGFESIDTLILGCTHYPLVEKPTDHYFREIARQSVQIISSSTAVAQKIAEELEKKDLLNTTGQKYLKDQFYISDSNNNFRQSAEIFFGKPVELQKIVL